MCDTKCLEKKRLQLKAKVDKLKEHRSKIRQEIKSSNKRKFHGKELNGKETSRDTECCNDKWANYTSLVIGLAPYVIKQVNSILVSDRTLIKKKSKQDDFLEHQRILQQALTAKPCDDGNANGKPPTPQRLLTLSFSRFTWHPDQLQRNYWRLWNSPDREFFTGGSKEPTDPGRDNLMQGSCWKLHHRFTFYMISKFLWLNFVLELKNCSKKEPGFERCQCLEAMNESNVETVKVKYAKTQGCGSNHTFYEGMPLAHCWLQTWGTLKEEKLYLSSANMQTSCGEKFYLIKL